MNSCALSTCQVPALSSVHALFNSYSSLEKNKSYFYRKRKLTGLERSILALPLPSCVDLNILLNPSEPQAGGQWVVVLVPSTSRGPVGLLVESLTPSGEGAHVERSALVPACKMHIAAFFPMFLNLGCVPWSEHLLCEPPVRVRARVMPVREHHAWGGLCVCFSTFPTTCKPVIIKLGNLATISMLVKTCLTSSPLWVGKNFFHPLTSV